MPKFFAYERAAHAGEKQGLRNVEFKKNDFENSLGAQAGSLLEIIPVHIKKPPVIQFIAYYAVYIEHGILSMATMGEIFIMTMLPNISTQMFYIHFYG